MTKLQEDPAVERARARLEKVRRFYIHLAAYVAVMTMLIVIDIQTGTPTDYTGTDFRVFGLDWAFWPLFGWGIAVAIDAAQTFGFTNLERRKLDKYIEQERKRELGPG